MYRNEVGSSNIDIYGNNSGKYFEFVFTSELVIDYSEDNNGKEISAQSIKYIYDGEKFYNNKIKLFHLYFEMSLTLHDIMPGIFDEP